MTPQFEWDDRKADVNLERHGVSFKETTGVFRDPLACIFDDEWHSVREIWELIIGHSLQYRLLVVCFTERSGVIRIISARPATRKERKNYEEQFRFSRG